MQNVVVLYDRLFWSQMMIQWQDGLVAICPDHADPFEWRDSARRLARHLECTVRTGLRTVADRGDRAKRVVAEANDGYPLGIVDPYERHDWLRAQCRGCDAADG